jgi:hypothetical protein
LQQKICAPKIRGAHSGTPEHGLPDLDSQVLFLVVTKLLVIAEAVSFSALECNGHPGTWRRHLDWHRAEAKTYLVSMGVL